MNKNKSSKGESRKYVDESANNPNSVLESGPDQTNLKRYLSRKEVAEMLGIALSTLHNYVKAGKVKAYGLGGRVFFLRSDIEKALKPLNEE